MNSDDGYRYPTGTPEHYGAYARDFETNYGIGYPAPDSPRASYEADFAWELAWDEYTMYGGDHYADPEAEGDADEKRSWVPYQDEEGNWILDPARDEARREPLPDLDIDPEPF
jgi:hypothetical protein